VRHHVAATGPETGRAVNGVVAVQCRPAVFKRVRRNAESSAGGAFSMNLNEDAGGVGRGVNSSGAVSRFSRQRCG